jgi:hypothetical protein
MLSEWGLNMRDNRAVLSALYTVLTEAHAMRRDAEAREIMQGHPARDLGAFTLLPTMERDLDWELSEERAARASAELEAAGFRTRIRTIEPVSFFD